MVEKRDLCPICGGKGTPVKNITVKHLVLAEIIKQVGNNDYFLCMNETCDITYFDQESGSKFNKNELKEPIWFKNDAKPKYACYCSKVTEEQIVEAVIYKDAKEMKDIINLTGAMKKGECEINNPLGKCCSPIIQEAIKKGLEIKRNNK